MAFRAAVRVLLASALVSGAFPVLAGTADSGSLEARVDRLLWQLVNDERYGHLQVAANYERLRAQLLEQACLVSAAPCAPTGKTPHRGATMTTEITPEQVKIIEELMFTLHSARADVAYPALHLMVTSAE